MPCLFFVMIAKPLKNQQAFENNQNDF